MKSIHELRAEQAAKLNCVLCDIDDTITTNGKLPAASYRAMWDLHDAGLSVIPVTGRPAGWCDLIVREWPVRAVIGENGAFAYYMRDGHLQTLTHPSVSGPEARARLKEVAAACLRGVPGCRVAKDQFFRRYDLAIDFHEDPPYLGLEAAAKIREICLSMGAQAKISSIHVNAWFGNYDKLKMTRLFFREVLKEENPAERCIFFGDSPNDEPMFSFFPNSCAVANILPFQAQLRHLPAFVTEQSGGEGFAEAVAHLLALRADTL